MTLLQPIVPRSLVEEAFHRLVDAITGGEIGPGQRITEAALASQLGVSRAVLREALQRLESLGLVTRTPNVGVHVIRPTEHDARELFAIMEAMGGLAASLAAQNMPETEIAEVEALVAAAEKAGSAAASPLLDAEEFQCRIAAGSRHARLEQMICGELRYQLRFYSHHLRAEGDWAAAAVGRRRAVLRAIQSRDTDLAHSAMRTHIAAWRENLLFAEAAGQG